MIVYSNDTAGFLKDVPVISDILKERIRSRLGEEASEGEMRSWSASLLHMAKVVSHPSIPQDAGIALEYNIPITNNRIDFIITGIDKSNVRQAILIELKQWSHIHFTEYTNIVDVNFGDGPKMVPHPSYQVASYASLLYDFNEVINTRKVYLHPCSYLHNYVDDGMITDSRFATVIQRAPVYLKDAQDDLRAFINQYIVKGDKDKVIHEIENSRIYPSKSLADCLGSMADGNPIFRLIDDQKVVYESILQAFDNWEKERKKTVIIVKGGPGTGKSVIAVKALIEMTRRQRLCHYVTKNAAPRSVFYRKFMEHKGINSSIRNLFKSSGLYYNAIENQYDMLIVDEAHRLQLHSGAYGNLGENQIEEIIRSAKVSVFFIDEHQQVSLNDIGSIESIYDALLKVSDENADVNGIRPFTWNVRTHELKSQFRCSGSDEFLNWLDHLLQYDNLLPISLRSGAYDIRLFEDPREMFNKIKQLNRSRNKARVVAGYCWQWLSKKDPKVHDIVFPEFRFKKQWNFNGQQDWAIREGSVDQVGCIHTCQGLEFDYCGVIIGDDLICKDGKIMVNPSKRATDDFSIRGWRKIKDSEIGQHRLRNIIKNTYRTLMTRGMKGCFLYVVDKELHDYIRKYLPQ